MSSTENGLWLLSKYITLNYKQHVLLYFDIGVMANLPLWVPKSKWISYLAKTSGTQAYKVEPSLAPDILVTSSAIFSMPFQE